MKQHVLRYSIIRFLPYVETEEFANVGVVLIAPEIGFFDFRLETKRISRLIHIFSRADQVAAKKILQATDRELKRIKGSVGHSPGDSARLQVGRGNSVDQLFESLVKPRGGAVRYSDVRFAMDRDPAKKLEVLHHFYVERKFVEHDSKQAGPEHHRAIL
jgi:hypothetical protein